MLWEGLDVAIVFVGERKEKCKMCWKDTDIQALERIWWIVKKSKERKIK